MGQAIRKIKVKIAYRWFLGYGMYESIPLFSTFGKNYFRRFEGAGLFKKLFVRITAQVNACGFLDMEQTEKIRHTKEMKKIYQQRKQTIERVFADIKKHEIYYMQYRWIAKIKMELSLLFCVHKFKEDGDMEMEEEIGREINPPHDSNHIQIFFSFINIKAK